MKFRSEEEMIRIYEAMADNVPANGKPQKIIELGCRNGDGTIALAKALKAKGCVYGILAIDQNEFAITEAKKNEEHIVLNIKYVRQDLDNINYDKMEKADFIFILDRDEYIFPTAEEIKILQSKCDYLHIVKHPDEARHNPLYKGWYGRMIDRESGKAEYMPHDFINENYLCDMYFDPNDDEAFDSDILYNCEILGKPTLLAYIVTAGRSETTLPLAITSIINSEVLPDELIIIDDNAQDERIDYLAHPMYRYLSDLLHQRGVKFNILYSPGREGQVKSHDYILKSFAPRYDYVLRLDDDCVLTPETIGIMRRKLDEDAEEAIGAVAGMVWIPGTNRKQPEWAQGLLTTHQHVTPQWYRIDNDLEVEHLHCSFMYRSKAALASDGYDTDLSPVGHTEETMFSHNIYRTGKKLIVAKDALIYHLRYPQGGIRDTGKADKFREYCFKADGDIFGRYVDKLGMPINENFVLCHLSFALGDHVLFAMALPKIAEYWKEKGEKVYVSTDWGETQELFGEYDNVEFVSLEEGAMCYFGKNVVYKWMVENNWQGSLLDGMVEMFTVKYDRKKIYVN